MLIEHPRQFRGDIVCVAVLDVAALHHVDDLAVAQYGNRR